MTITELLQHYGLMKKPYFKSIEQQMLAYAKRDRVVKAIKDFATSGEINPLIEPLIVFLSSKGYEIVSHSVFVGYKDISGNIDLVLQDSEKNLYIASVSTSKSYDRESVEWKFGLLNAFAKYKYQGSYAIIINEDKPLEIRDVYPKSLDDINRLIYAYENNEDFRPKEIVKATSTELIAVDMEDKLYNLDKQIKELTKIRDEIKSSLVEEMKVREMTSVSSVNGKVSLTTIPAKASMTFDSVTFKKENPELYKKYLKEKITSEQVRMTFKEEKEDE